MDKFIFDTSKYSNEQIFNIVGVSYAGAPKNNTALFISKKVEELVLNLGDKKECLVFIDRDVDVPKQLLDNNLFVRCDNPQYEYALFAHEIQKRIQEFNNNRQYHLTKEGYWKGENVTIGQNVQIEKGAFIDHDVVIGDNVLIYNNVVIKNTVIGNNCLIYENCSIGNIASNYVKVNNQTVLIPMLGNVIIKDNVVIGALTDIPRGMAGSTIIEKGVIIGSCVAVGHDDIIGENTSIVSNVTIGGHTRIGSNVYVGLGSTIKNRLVLGDSSYICMGSVVIRNVEAKQKVFGNPARVMMK